MAGPGRGRAAGPSLHLVLTPSQKPTDLLAAGEEFGRVLGSLTGLPVRVTVAVVLGVAVVVGVAVAVGVSVCRRVGVEVGR